ncbi:MAG: replication initiation factor domain-containing protein [Rhodospirillaceae bacterium]
MMVPIPVQAITDYLNITVPLGESAGLDAEILQALRPVFPYPMKGTTDIHEIGEYDRQRGTLKMAPLRPVYVVSLSGLALRFIRGTGCFPAFLHVLNKRSHRVSRLDAALDIRGLDGPPFIAGLHRKLLKKGIRIGQRAAPMQVHFGHDKRKAWTGSLYIGGKAGRVRVIVYDKRHEQESRGYSDPGPWVRVELRFRGGDQGVAVSLPDLADPTALFWAHLPEGIIETPPGVPEWTPATDPAGFKLPPRMDRKPEDDLRRWVQRHGWQGQQLADDCGPYGRRLLLDLMHLLPNLQEIPF